MSGAHVVVIGAGPAGLTAADELTRLGIGATVLEQSHVVGGLARTEQYRGYRFDIGGHRFYTKVPEIERFWREVLGDDLLTRRRLSRIYYRRRFFPYPLRLLDTLAGLGLVDSVLAVGSFVRQRIAPEPREDTFEDWVTRRFGRRLFETFFRTYTEKVWGIPCSELRAEWAAQRIRDLSLTEVLLRMVWRPRRQITTLIEAFQYPRLGPGMLWAAVQARVARGGGVVRLTSEVTRIHRRGTRVDGVTVRTPSGKETLQGSHVISSMPVTEAIQRLEPAPGDEVLAAARALRHRAFLTVCLVMERAELFPDQWIYVHEPSVRVARIQNFKNWSPAMVPDPGRTSLGLEYFCNEGDDLWCMPDRALIELAGREVEAIGLGRREEVVDGCVVRMAKAYPVYDSRFGPALATVRGFLDTLDNFQTIGRNGLHRYNNQDHAMLTGLLAARNVAHGSRHDLWSVNAEPVYLEEHGRAGR